MMPYHPERVATKMQSAIAVFDIDGVIRDVGGSYRRALADTVERFTDGAFRPSMDEIDRLKGEGAWNNDWHASQELIYRHFEGQGRSREAVPLDYGELVHFFQCRYRGPNPEDPETWTGYINDEPLLVTAAYFEALTAAGVAWGFFSGATRPSALYVLTRRLGLTDPLLVAMGDAPDKPNPEGLLMVADRLTPTQLDGASVPVIYAGDTVADMQTVTRALAAAPDRPWLAVGILPPHVLGDRDRQRAYTENLVAAGADLVIERVTDLTGERIEQLLAKAPKAI